jgi:hypothetical protein
MHIVPFLEIGAQSYLRKTRLAEENMHNVEPDRSRFCSLLCTISWMFLGRVLDISDLPFSHHQELSIVRNNLIK